MELALTVRGFGYKRWNLPTMIIVGVETAYINGFAFLLELTFDFWYKCKKLPTLISLV